MTMTPADLVATIGHAVADGATAEQRRAGRQACVTLAAVLGEPGDPMSWPGTGAPNAGGRPDRTQLIEFAMMKMREFLSETEAKEKAAAEAAATAAAAPPPQAPPPRPSAHATAQRSTQPPARPMPNSRPLPAVPTHHHRLRIPMVRPLPRRSAP